MNALPQAAPATGEDCLVHPNDLLEGAEAIGRYMFPHLVVGEDVRAARRRVYYLLEAKGARPPMFRVGSIVCARKSRLREWMEAQESGRPA